MVLSSRATADATYDDALIADQPKNPYLYELKGQVLFEAGRTEAGLGWIRQYLRVNST